MATSFQRRPGERDPALRVDATKLDPALEAQLQKLDAQKRALEQRGGDAEVDAELASKLQPTMGNSAIQALLNRATDTATTTADAGLDQAQEEEEDKDEEKETESGEIEHVLPSFSTGGGGGGGGGPNAPAWASGHEFGGDDDADPMAVAAAQPRWRPMPYLVDPDEDAELDAADPEAPPTEPDAVDLRGAERALGARPWELTFLGRGMRQVRRLARRDFGPESLVDADGLDHAVGRLRALLRFVARYGDAAPAVMVARAATGGGEACFPVAGGFSGATSRAAALAEVTLALLGPTWEPVLDVALDPRARPRAEHAAEAMIAQGRLSSAGILASVLGGGFDPASAELVLEAHPAAFAAVEGAARTEPLPLVDLWERPTSREEDADVAAIDAVLARFTGALDLEPDALGEPELAGLLEALHRLVGGFGGVHVEVAAAAVAASNAVGAPDLGGVLGLVDEQLRRGARRVVHLAAEVRGLVGTDAFDRVRTLSAEAVAVRTATDLVRRGAICTIARLLFPHAPQAWAPPLPRAEAAFHLGRMEIVRAEIVRAGRALAARFHAGSLLLRAGFPDDALPHLAAAGRHRGPLGIAAHTLVAGLHLSRERWADARRAAAVVLARSRRAGLEFCATDAAMTLATAEARLGGDWRAPLAAMAAHHRAREGGAAALNLLKARWAEIETG